MQHHFHVVGVKGYAPGNLWTRREDGLYDLSGSAYAHNESDIVNCETYSQGTCRCKFGDMSALAELMGQVAEHWTVDIANHDQMSSSGEAVITRISDNIYGAGPGFDDVRTDASRRAGYYVWPTARDDFEIDGLTLTVYNRAHAYVHGNRAVTLRMMFKAPEGV
jgi:hypothetical protein